MKQTMLLLFMLIEAGTEARSTKYKMSRNTEENTILVNTHHFDRGGKHWSNSSSPNWGYFYVAESIRLGVEKAVSECHHQFRWDRWNCPISANTLLHKAPYDKATREVSFIQAISAAGVMYYVTKSCNKPKQDLCGCTNRKHSFDSRKEWHWAGCRQDVKFGEKVSRLYLGTDGVSGDTRAMLKRHNERTGHKAVLKQMKTVCKCHGLTGDCSFKTCWKQLSTFRAVGSNLKRKYQKSKDLYNNNKARHLRRTQLSEHNLMFVDSSPNYCKADSAYTGHLGTFGRECRRHDKDTDTYSLSKWERNSCRRLCRSCGYKTKKSVSEEVYDCDCKFAWCCSVECMKCKTTVARYYCT